MIPTMPTLYEYIDGVLYVRNKPVSNNEELVWIHYSDYMKLRQHAEQLQVEKDALAAQLVAIQDAALKPRGRTRQQWIDNIKRHALEISARECLAEVKTQVINDTAVYICDRAFKAAVYKSDIIGYASEYAAKVRQGGAK